MVVSFCGVLRILKRVHTGMKRSRPYVRSVMAQRHRGSRWQSAVVTWPKNFVASARNADGDIGLRWLLVCHLTGV